MSQRRLIAATSLSLLAAACSDGGSGPASTNCDPSAAPVSLQALHDTTLTAADVGGCLNLAGATGTYLVVPQFAAQAAKPTPIDFLLSTSDVGGTRLQASVRAGALSAPRRPMSAALRFHQMLRQRDAELAAEWVARSPAVRAAALSAMSAQASAGAPAATRNFQVLKNLNGKEFATVTANLKYSGNNIYLYVDQAAPPDGFSDAQWQSFGKLFDETLYPIDVTTFGSTSDIDANGHVITLFTPVVNALVDPVKDGCGSYVAGFFTGFDLTNTGTNSNRGEVFYASVPDPDGDSGCSLSLGQVNYLTPATFIHELQHMISYNQHVLVRGGAEEDTWLNEGLSLIAEELGGRHFEALYPPPSGRSSPSQLFPDSARGFLEPNLGYAYDWMRSTTDSSVTTFVDFGSLSERGAAWIFLRWLVDHKGDAILAKLDQTNLRGVANVSQQAGESFPKLFGDFSIALWTDSLPGVPREAIPERNRFLSRNLRELFGAMSASIPESFPDAYPLEPTGMNIGDEATATMVPGTMAFYTLSTAGTAASIPLRFSRPDKTQLPQSAAPQVSLFRLPDAP